MCDCKKENNHPSAHDPLIPQVATIIDIRFDTPDITTYRVVGANGKQAFSFRPGQCAMLTVVPVGEAIFSITSSPTQTDYMEFSIKSCGTLTNYLREVEVGTEIGLRGPYGNSFPVEELRNKDLLFIAGGIGFAPLRSVINYMQANRKDYGKIDILYGSRSADDFVQKDEIFNVLPKCENTNVHLTIDRAQEGWEGHVGFVPSYLEELNFSTDKTVLVCGPPIMIKFVLAALEKIGFKKEQVYTTLELKMKCGIGKCGRCNIGNKYVCKDGPVFRCDELDEMPDEF